ncbi:MAG: branched-chain amino acid ABC transporter permease [Kiloniellales bacterium]|nr:branched-chain amino acid ABC transporter permease [Kiloniellales bacterium]
MIYREVGQFKTSYASDQGIFQIAQDRWFIFAIVFIALAVVPLIINDYFANAVLLPFLVYSLAALGLNILTGYCGQLSLGTGAFLAVGAYSSYKLMTAFPEVSIIIHFILSGGITAAVGVLFGLPSLRIKGFYLAVATLFAQFFIIWLFYKVPWFFNYNATGQISVPPREVFGVLVTGPEATPAATYLFTLVFVLVGALLAKNMVRSRTGRSWMAIRDMDIAAEIIGINPLKTKLLAFAVSCFYIGVAGALMFAVWLGAAESGEAFGIDQSFLVLFMIIIGGLGSIMGSFLGAAFMVLMPILLKQTMVDGMGLAAVTAKHVEFILMGCLIIFFLIVEPHGLARLWQIAKEKLRLWPFPH